MGGNEGKPFFLLVMLSMFCSVEIRIILVLIVCDSDAFDALLSHEFCAWN